MTMEDAVHSHEHNEEHAHHEEHHAEAPAHQEHMHAREPIHHRVHRTVQPYLPYISVFMSIAALIVSIIALLSINSLPRAVIPGNTVTTTIIPLTGYNIQGSLIVPNATLADSPVITANEPFGTRLTGINQPFNSTELAIINRAPDTYFDQAANMLVNHNITNIVGAQVNSIVPFVLNGKPSVIYYGSITCIYCAENRWAMALALSRFGNFFEPLPGLQRTSGPGHTHALLCSRPIQLLINRAGQLLQQQLPELPVHRGCEPDNGRVHA